MFRNQAAGHDRVLIASANSDDRRHIGDIAKSAGLRAVGFIREPEQVCTRARLSMPDVLLLDVGIYEQAQQNRASFNDLHAAGNIRIIVCGHKLGTKSAQQWKRDGIDGTLELTGAAGKGVESMAQSLCRALDETSVACAPAPVPAAVVPTPVGAKRKTLQPECVVVGSSTGGPMALMEFAKGLPADLSVPMAVVQHMPPGFTRMLAERLNAECAVRVVEAEAGMQFEAGTVYIAPGGFHMAIEGNSKCPRVSLNTQEPENSCRPAVDVLFRSSARVYGGRQHAIVLTGMGRDGLAGATQLYGLGSRVVVQDAATSTVWGMPGAIAQAGYADDILPIDQIAPQLLRYL